MAYSMREERQSLAAHTSSMDFQEIDALQQQWLRFRKQREQLNPNAYKAFLARLDRRWAIETGIIEGLYNLERQTIMEALGEPEPVTDAGMVSILIFLL
ncbi:MAG: hypothetical protein OXG26_03225 [Caldilineaceae bacterium]|nr:hypothetical protein [Caldilineaceae bacterium]